MGRLFNCVTCVGKKGCDKAHESASSRRLKPRSRWPSAYLSVVVVEAWL